MSDFAVPPNVRRYGWGYKPSYQAQGFRFGLSGSTSCPRYARPLAGAFKRAGGDGTDAHQRLAGCAGRAGPLSWCPRAPGARCTGVVSPLHRSPGERLSELTRSARPAFRRAGLRAMEAFFRRRAAARL